MKKLLLLGVASVGTILTGCAAGNGYAAVIAAHLVLECERRGLKTVWGCDMPHRASVSVARKLGYPNIREYSHVWNKLALDNPTAM